MNLRPLGKNIIFIFLEEVSQGRFTPSHASGIILTNKNVDVNREPKWGKVFLTGPDCDDEIKVGDYILVESLCWTPGFDFDGIKFWKTDSDKVMMVSDTPQHSY